MTDNAKHPVVAAFESLVQLRHHVAGNPADSGTAFVSFCAANYMRSHAQLFQDLFVVFILSGKRSGFFVDFGATDGIALNNTAILEKELGWRGILAEPARCWHEALARNRAAAIDHRLVWSTSGAQLNFKETSVAELSTLTSLVDADFNAGDRAHGTVYPVETISLNDLLAAHDAPRSIDYLSIDTEGSEMDILSAFAFDRYDVDVVTVEHNFVEAKRQAIHGLLTSHGFIRVFNIFSSFDDWYVKRKFLGAKGTT